MKDIQKIKEFFLKDRAMAAAYEAKESKKEDVLGDWISDMLKYKSYEEVKRILLNNLRDALMDDELVAKIKKEKNINEAQEEDVVDTITMDVPLFIRMLEYSREDASADVDLHDVTEKAISLNKEKDILSMDDYNEIVGATEEIEEGVYGKGDKRRGLQNASKLSSAEYQMAKKLKSFKASDWKWNADEDLYVKVVKEVTTDYTKRRQAQNDYPVNKKDTPAKSYNPKHSGETDYIKSRKKELAEAILAKLKK